MDSTGPPPSDGTAPRRRLRHDRPYPLVTLQDVESAASWFRSAGWSVTWVGPTLEVSWHGCRLSYTSGERANAQAAGRGIALAVPADSLEPAQAMFQASPGSAQRKPSRFGEIVFGDLPGGVRLVVVRSSEGPVE